MNAKSFDELKQSLQEAAQHKLNQEIRELLQIWHDDTAMHSSISAIANHGSYERIVNMGDAAVDQLLLSIHEHTTRCILALTDITKENPVKAENRGNLKRMAQDWVDFSKTWDKE